MKDEETPTREEVIEKESKELDQLPDSTIEGIEDAKKWRTPGLQRMRIDWRGEDSHVWEQVRSVVDLRIQQEFADAYRLMNEIYDIVRTPMTNEHGEVMVDHHGYPIWKRGPYGEFEENWNLLNHKQKEDFMFALTTRLFFWQQLAADAWGEAMLAKAAWEEMFSMGYDDAKSGTVDHRTAKGKLNAREDRYFAVLLSYHSRKADAVCRSMELLSQRLKDSMTL